MDPVQLTILSHLTASAASSSSELGARHAYSLEWVFNGDINPVDDVVFHFSSFLTDLELVRICSLSSRSRKMMEGRQEFWKAKCKCLPVDLPKRPRLTWFRLYFSLLKKSYLTTLSLSNELLLKCSAVLQKGDNLIKMKKLVLGGIKSFNFDVNFTSGTVGERNSILNLSVILGRRNVARWLVTSMRANVESRDRGCFTPLLNATWNNDFGMVRFLLSNGSDRSAVGIAHSSGGFKEGFQGWNSEEWAREKGFKGVERLIRYGV